jgi:hypothetical protein
MLPPPQFTFSHIVTPFQANPLEGPLAQAPAGALSQTMARVLWGLIFNRDIANGGAIWSIWSI